MIKPFLNVPPCNSFRLPLITVFWLLIVALTGIASAETISGAPVMEITFQDNLISAELVDVPLIDVLKRIKQEFGFKTHFYGDLGELITLSFNEVPLDKCLRLLTANQSLSVAFVPPPKLPQTTKTKQIAEIWVLSRSKSPYPKNLAPVAQIPSSDDSDSVLKANENSSDQSQSEQVGAVPLDERANQPDTEKTNQEQAVKDLTELNDSASVAAMVDLLTSIQNKEDRIFLVNEIGSIQNEESTQVLAQVFRQDSDPEIRKTAIRALGQRKNDSVARAVLEQALNDDDDEVKALADQMLTQ